ASSDLSSTYYNPAWLALERKPSILLSTRSAELYNLKVKNGFGAGTEPNDTRLVASPSFFGGKFTTNIADDKVAIAVTYLQKTQFRYSASGIIIDENPAPPPAGSLWFSGEAKEDYDLSEQWLDVSFAQSIGKNIYFGISPFVVLRDQDIRSQVFLKGINSESDFAHVYSMNYAYYFHVRMLAKMGLAFDYSPVSFGITFTTPSFGLFGLGEAQQDYSLSGINLDPQDETDDLVVAANYQEDLTPQFHSAFSVAIGTAYQRGNTGFYFSAEYFNGTDRFDILSPEPFSVQSNSTEFLEYDISYATRPILNWGLAINHKFSNTFILYGSFWTDQSTADQDENPTMMMGFWNNLHTNMGASFTFFKVEITMGLGYSFGKETANSYQYFGQEQPEGFVKYRPDQELIFKRIKLLIGLNFLFGKNEG
ncbi:MAG: hypothetical protein GY780_16460, partial [bacterium]|nr:hypothetical protein [bacterium]